MGRPRLLFVGLTSLLVLFRAAAAAPDATSAALQAAARERRWPDVVQAVEGLRAPTAEDEYWAGLALVELHRPVDAWTHLVAAKEAAFRAPTDWPTPEKLLSRATTAINLTPPARPTDERSDAAIVVRAGPPTEWSEPIVRATPEFAAVGRRIFGKDVPPVTLHLFADRRPFIDFYGALLGVQPMTPWQDGTGTTNVVLFCERDEYGRSPFAAGTPDTLGSVLHEFGHAWFATHLMNRHRKDWLAPSIRRPWLDEGMADYVASLREPEYLTRRADSLRKRASNFHAPTFEDLADCDAFYGKGDVRVRYCVAALLVAELIGPTDRAPETIRKLLDEIGRTGDVDKSVATASGKNVREEFERVVKRFW